MRMTVTEVSRNTSGAINAAAAGEIVTVTARGREHAIMLSPELWDEAEQALRTMRGLQRLGQLGSALPGMEEARVA
ncbi:type II toxin-antitoxin system prevent-host-death family antitoxin [Saccharopolyspora cebuensis]|uniref:type II toxin-antitoxin system prevent-host-death family antitoxin n=1 Tax=Saccharopolyspora cebuensis TaxID=418759 RepID=UPI0031F0FC26